MSTRMTRRGLLRASLIAATSIIAAACQPRPAATPGEAQQTEPAAPTVAQSPPAPTPLAKVSLRYFSWLSPEDGERYDKVFREFTLAYPHIEVANETMPGTGAAVYPDLLRTSIVAGDPPDAFWLWGGSIAFPFIDAGQILELTSYYDQYDWHALFAPWAVAALSRGGKVYGVPRVALGMGLWYRKDIFEQYKLSVPETYSDLEAISAALKDNGIYAGTVGGKYGWHTMRVLDYFIEHTAGPELHDKLNNFEVSWDIPEVVEAYRLLKRWCCDRQWLVPDFLTIAPGDARWPWYKGEAAMILEGPWMEAVIKEDEQDPGKFDFFLPPTDHEPLRYSAFPEQTMIAKASKHPDETAQLLNYLSIPETQKRHPDTFVNSATVGVTPNCEEWPFTCRWREIILTARYTYPPTDQVFVKELMDGYFEVQDSVVAGRLTPEEAARTLQQRVEQWKAKT